MSQNNAKQAEYGTELKLAGRVAQAFDLAGLTNRAGAPSLRVLCEGAGTTNACSDGLCDSIPKRNPRPALIDSDWTSLPRK
jgi:hypothetical protein